MGEEGETGGGKSEVSIMEKVMSAVLLHHGIYGDVILFHIYLLISELLTSGIL